MAPVMTAFSAGTVVGPAVGGALAGNIGVGPAVCCVGGVFFFNAMATRFGMAETMPQPPPPPPPQQGKPPPQQGKPPGSPLAAREPNTEGRAAGAGSGRGAVSGWGSGVLGAVRDTLSQWRPVLAQPELRAVVALHSAYWACMAGEL